MPCVPDILIFRPFRGSDVQLRVIIALEYVSQGFDRNALASDKKDVLWVRPLMKP